MLASVSEGGAAAWDDNDRPWWWHLPRKTQLEDLFDCTSRGVGAWWGRDAMVADACGWGR